MQDFDPIEVTEEVVLIEEVPKKNRFQVFFTVPVAILFSGVLVALAILFQPLFSQKILGLITPKTTSPTPAQLASPSLENVKPVTKNDHIRGNPNAPLVMVVYSDLECPYCKVLHQTVTTLMNEYGAQGKLALVYRNFPIASLIAKLSKKRLRLNVQTRSEDQMSIGNTSMKYSKPLIQTTASIPQSSQRLQSESVLM